MKKLMFLFLVATLILTGCGGDSEPTAASTTTATEPKTRTVYVHSSITRTDASATYRTEYLYRDNDTLCDVVICNEAGTEVQHYRVNCDENGNPLDWIATEDGANSKISYRFDQWGHTVGTYVYTGGDLVTSTEYTFSGDLRVSTTVKTAAQNYDQRTEYTYDDKNQLIRQDLYISGELTSYSICTCDEQGRLLTSQGYDLDNQPTGTITCTYEEHTETRVTTDATGTVLQTQVMTYDAHGNLLTSTITDGDGNLRSKEEHTWKPIEVPVDSPRASF